MFGLPRRFAVDLPALEARYRDLQREVHPDRFSTASASEQRQSMEMATRVNEAQAGHLAKAAVEAGNNICWIRNTVFDAQAAYEAVRKHLNPDKIIYFTRDMFWATGC